jgi:hypothetical protein
MPFGWSGGDKKLEQQKAALQECTDSLAFLEKRVAHLAHLEATFADVWPRSSGVPAELRAKAGKIRELIDLLAYRATSAKRELANFDNVIDLMKGELPLLHRDWQAFTGLLVARRSIASGELAIAPTSDPPTVTDCQRALIAIAERHRDRLREHVDELTEVKPTFDGPWPEDLDLGKWDAGLRDVGAALDVNRERIRGGELAIDSTSSLWEMIEIMEASLDTIVDRRPELALHTLTKQILDNLEKGQPPSA